MPDGSKQVYFCSEGPCPLVILCSQKGYSPSGSHECAEVICRPELTYRYKCFLLSSSTTQKSQWKCKTIKIPKLEQEDEYLLILSPYWSRHPQCPSMTAETAQCQINCVTSYSPKQRCWPWAQALLQAHCGVCCGHTSVCTKYQNLWAETQHTAMLWLLWEHRENIAVLIMTSFQPASVTASQLCHLLEDSRCLSARKRKCIHRAVFIVSLEAAGLAQSTQSQSFILKDSSLSSFQGTGMINFFLR